MSERLAIGAVALLAVAGAMRRRGTPNLQTIQAMLSEIERKTLLRAEYEADEYIGLKIVLFAPVSPSGEMMTPEEEASHWYPGKKPTWKQVGVFRVSEAMLSEIERAPEECKREWRKLGKPPLWVVRTAEWFEPSLRRRGFAKIVYRALFEYVRARGGVVGPDSCAGGSTSPDAERVWKSLRTQYETTGPLIRPIPLPAKGNLLALYLARRGSSNKHFAVTSPAQGLKAIEHQVFRSNHQKALKVKPSSSTAVLIPCASTKPFTEAPSHKHGYLPALQGLDVDTYVVAEPLGVIPQPWSEAYPNYAYDFPPSMLKGQAREALVERIAEWMDKVGSKYDRVVAALPQHHMKLVQDANKEVGLELTDASIGACRDSVCSQRSFRATSPQYRKWLRGIAQHRGSAARKPKAFITDMGESSPVHNMDGDYIGAIPRYGVWTDLGRGKPQVAESSNDLKYLMEKWSIPAALVFKLPAPRKGSLATAQTHAMKLPAWTLRLESGTKALKRATKRGDLEQIVAGLEDVSFWVGRSVGDAFGAAGKGGASKPQLRLTGNAIVQAQVAIFDAHGHIQRGSKNLVRQVQGALTPELLHPEHPGGKGPLAGHCYVATQALWHLMGGAQSGYTPHSGPAPGGDTHWWLVQQKTGKVLDPTSSQFPRYDYGKGTARGFLTKDPSQRARVVMGRVRNGNQ